MLLLLVVHLYANVFRLNANHVYGQIIVLFYLSEFETILEIKIRNLGIAADYYMPCRRAAAKLFGKYSCKHLRWKANFC